MITFAVVVLCLVFWPVTLLVLAFYYWQSTLIFLSIAILFKLYRKVSL